MCFFGIQIRSSPSQLPSPKNMAWTTSVSETPSTTPSMDFSSPSRDPNNIGNITLASALGACSGFAAKRLAKGAGLGIGLGFMALQVLTALIFFQGLAQTGLIKINWPLIEETFHTGLDLVIYVFCLTLFSEWRWQD
jgi:uncharacterized membrane protein (Fun14 family)